MKEVLILSGKGGTGKTSIVGSFAAIAKNKVMADCDVDAADLHLLLSPLTKKKNEFHSGQVAVIDKDKCTACSECVDECPNQVLRIVGFKFIIQHKHVKVVEYDNCTGCLSCVEVCPEDAIRGI